MDRGKMIYTELNGIRDGKTCGVFYRYLHRRMWNWLADTHGRKYKKDWPEWAINGGIVPMAESYCFACAATDSCSNCPIDWNYRDVEAMLPDMPYCYKNLNLDSTLVAHGLRLIHILPGHMTLTPATANVSPEL